MQRSRPRLALAAGLGADLCIGIDDGDPVAAVLGATGGRGADATIVAAGTGSAQCLGLQITAKRGRLNLFGGLPKREDQTPLDSNVIHYREIVVQGSYSSSARHHREALTLLATRQVTVDKLVSRIMPLAQAAEAFGVAETKHLMKLVLRP